MAKGKSAPSASTENLARAPKGFRNLGSVTADCWFALKPGNIIQGKFLGCYSRDDKRSKTGKSEFSQILHRTKQTETVELAPSLVSLPTKNINRPSRLPRNFRKSV
jgi:hypothetical protein